jgi:hypothetical protein
VVIKLYLVFFRESGDDFALAVGELRAANIRVDEVGFPLRKRGIAVKVFEYLNATLLGWECHGDLNSRANSKPTQAQKFRLDGKNCPVMLRAHA